MEWKKEKEKRERERSVCELNRSCLVSESSGLVKWILLCVSRPVKQLTSELSHRMKDKSKCIHCFVCEASVRCTGGQVNCGKLGETREKEKEIKEK